MACSSILVPGNDGHFIFVWTGLSSSSNSSSSPDGDDEEEYTGSPARQAWLQKIKAGPPVLPPLLDYVESRYLLSTNIVGYPRNGYITIKINIKKGIVAPPFDPLSLLLVKVAYPNCETEDSITGQFRHSSYTLDMDMFLCRIPAYNPGVYTITATTAINKWHVPGSPLDCRVTTVARDYLLGPYPGASQFERKSTMIMPWGMTYAPDTEAVYVADRLARRIIRYVKPCPVVLTFETTPYSSKGFRPTGIAYDPFLARLIVTEKDFHHVCIFSADGQLLSTIGKRGSADGHFRFPWGVALSPDGSRFAVTDTSNYRIQLFDRDGRFISKFTCAREPPVSRRIKSPRGITFSNEGNYIYFTDYGLHRICRLTIRPNDMMGDFRVILGQSLDCPSGIAVDSGGRLLVCDYNNHCIRVVLPNGNIWHSIYDTGTANINKPTNLVVLPRGHIGLLDNAGRVHIF